MDKQTANVVIDHLKKKVDALIEKFESTIKDIERRSDKNEISKKESQSS